MRTIRQVMEEADFLVDKYGCVPWSEYRRLAQELETIQEVVV